MKITQEMIKEKMKVYNDLIKKNTYYMNIFLKTKDKDITEKIRNIIKFQNEFTKFTNTLSGKDKYIFLDEMIKYSDDLLKIFEYMLKKDYDKEENKINWKILAKDIKRISKLRRKMENKYEDDDDEFFNYAAWFL